MLGGTSRGGVPHVRGTSRGVPHVRGTYLCRVAQYSGVDVEEQGAEHDQPKGCIA